MDLNQLYFDHQILQMRADSTSRPLERVQNQRGASVLAGRIARRQHELGAAASAAWTALAITPVGATTRHAPPGAATGILHQLDRGRAER